MDKTKYTFIVDYTQGMRVLITTLSKSKNEEHYVVSNIINNILKAGF